MEKIQAVIRKQTLATQEEEKRASEEAQRQFALEEEAEKTQHKLAVEERKEQKRKRAQQLMEREEKMRQLELQESEERVEELKAYQASKQTEYLEWEKQHKQELVEIETIKQKRIAREEQEELERQEQLHKEQLEEELALQMELAEREELVLARQMQQLETGRLLKLDLRRNIEEADAKAKALVQQKAQRKLEKAKWKSNYQKEADEIERLRKERDDALQRCDDILEKYNQSTKVLTFTFVIKKE
jgi:hypothetical protein